MSASQWFLAAVIVFAVTVQAALILWLRRYRRKVIRVPREDVDAKIARWNAEAAEQAHGVDGDVIARIGRYQQEYDIARARWLEDGEQR